MLADVGAGAGLRRDDAAATAAALLAADDAELRRPDTAGQVHVEDGAELLEQLEGSTKPEPLSRLDLTGSHTVLLSWFWSNLISFRF